MICYEKLALVGLGIVDELDDRVFEHFELDSWDI